jgi:outer membrane protein assembly factor BamA
MMHRVWGWRLGARGPITVLGLGVTLLLPASTRAQDTIPVIAEIRVHGNHTTPDAEVLRIAAIAVGERADAATLDAARSRLLQSRRFPAVEIRTRYRSLTDTSRVALVVIVTEHPAVSPIDVGVPPIPGPLGRLRRSAMFLPILDYEDGYGLTYGARASFVGTLGQQGRLSVPASWRGTRQVALEADRTFDRGPLSRLRGHAGIWRRENPFYRIGETRREAGAEASRRFGPSAGVGLTGTLANVRFGDIDTRTTAVGAFAELDTRRDPLFARNAVYARSSVARLGFEASPDVLRVTHDVRGYLGLVGQSVLAVRLHTINTDGPTPPFAKALLGGAATLRGMRAGSFVGDNLVSTSAELRVPFSSPLNVARTGVALFYDAGVAWDHAEAWRDSRLERGVGAGLFITAPFVQLQLDVARGIDRSTRVHLTTGVRF